MRILSQSLLIFDIPIENILEEKQNTNANEISFVSLIYSVDMNILLNTLIPRLMISWRYILVLEREHEKTHLLFLRNIFLILSMRRIITPKYSKVFSSHQMLYSVLDLIFEPIMSDSKILFRNTLFFFQNFQRRVFHLKKLKR